MLQEDTFDFDSVDHMCHIIDVLQVWTLLSHHFMSAQKSASPEHRADARTKGLRFPW